MPALDNRKGTSYSENSLRPRARERRNEVGALWVGGVTSPVWALVVAVCLSGPHQGLAGGERQVCDPLHQSVGLSSKETLPF